MKTLEENKDKKRIEVIYELKEIMNCKIDYSWFVGIADYILGCKCNVCDSINEMDFKITMLIIKL